MADDKPNIVHLFGTTSNVLASGGYGARQSHGLPFGPSVSVDASPRIASSYVGFCRSTPETR